MPYCGSCGTLTDPAPPPAIVLSWVVFREKGGSSQGFPQRLSKTPAEHQEPQAQLLQQQRQRRQQQQQQQQKQQQEQQQQQQQQQEQQQEQQRKQQQQLLLQEQQRRQHKRKQTQRVAAGAGHLFPLPNGHQSSAATYAEDAPTGLAYDASQRVLPTQQAVGDQLRNGPSHSVLEMGTRRRTVTPADGYLQQMGGINTPVVSNSGHGQGPGHQQEQNDPWTPTVHPGNGVFPLGGIHAHGPYYQPQQSLPMAAAVGEAVGGAVAVAHEAGGAIVYNSRETSPLAQPALEMSAVGRVPSVAGGRGAPLSAQSQSVDKGLLEALGMGEGGHRTPAQAGGLLTPSSQFQQRDVLGARSTVEPPELTWVTDHRGQVDRDQLLNGTEGPAAGRLGALGQHYGDLRHASPPARFADDSAYTENLEAAQIAARSLLPAGGRRAAARSAAEGLMHLGI